MKNKFLFILLVALLGLACGGKKITVTRAIYYWKSGERYISTEEQNYLDSLKMEKLYVKFFEVEKDPTMGNIPTAKTDIELYRKGDTYNPLRSMEIIPSIYIRNEVLKGITAQGIDSLADNISYLTDKYFYKMTDSLVQLNEIQLDCDWTASTKDAYFELLKAVKKYSKKSISCTLRLYPYKYSDKMGVPPVDKATLMCYNLISPVSNPRKNSILDNKELEAYMTGKTYPLPLDIALPVFSWMQWYKEEQFAGIIQQDTEALLSVLRPIDKLWYRVEKDTVVGDYYLREGDKIKYEKVSSEDLYKAIEVLKKELAYQKSATISLFHLNELTLKQYETPQLNSFYTNFSH